MFRGFVTGFIVLVLLIAFILYIYGQKTLSTIFSASQISAPGNTQVLDSSIKNWTDYTPPSKKFNAKFPSSPQHATDRSIDSGTLEPKEYEMYISESEGNVFMISVISFPKKNKLKNEEILLKSIVDDMVASNPNNKLEKIENGLSNDRKNVTFVITNTSYAITGQAFIDSNQLYVLSVLSKTQEDSKKQFDYFVKSFKLQNKSPSLAMFTLSQPN